MHKSVAGAMVGGALRFALVSMLAFAVWAVGGRMSEGVLFAATGVAFLAMGEIFLPGLAHPPDARKKFNRSFVPAFIAYAVVWSAFWFALHSRLSEWLGLAGGCAAFAWILGKRLGAKSGYVSTVIVLFAANSAGYFLGDYVFAMARNPPEIFSGWEKKEIWQAAKLAWGLCFGLGFGAGIGYAFHQFQKPGAQFSAPTLRM